MYTTERRRMSLHEQRRRDPPRVSAGSLWQDSLVMDQSANSSVKHIVSPRSRTRAISVAYIVNEDASANLSLTCLEDACADAHASLSTISFERISLGTTDVLDGFYNAGKCWLVCPVSAGVCANWTKLSTFSLQTSRWRRWATLSASLPSSITSEWERVSAWPTTSFYTVTSRIATCRRSR